MPIRFIAKMVLTISWTSGLLFSLGGALHAQQLTQPRQQGCTPQGEPVTQPTVDSTIFCPEYLVNNLPRSATAAITSIAYAPACTDMAQPQDWCGRLFFVRPDEGLLQWVGDFDPATNQYTRHTFAAGLTTPNGLVWHDDAWYVTGAQHIYRLTDTDQNNQADELVTLIDSLPQGAGGWTGSIGIGPDERLYISLGASCNACQEADDRRAAILSYDLNGNDEQVYASGLRQAFDFTWHPTSGHLWTVDSERSHRGETLPLDELNRVPEADLNFGWPFCYETPGGTIADPLIGPDTDASSCESTTAPALTFPAHSNPGGMAFYNSPALPEFTGDLLVVLQGSWDSRLPIGYAVYRVCFDDEGELEICPNNNNSLERFIPTARLYPNYDDTTLSLQEFGFYPDHPVDVAVSPAGKIAVATLEGRIIELTPLPQSN